MDIVLFLLHIRGLKPLLVFYFRVEETFAGGKFRGKKISRKIKIREYSENLLHAKNWCFTVDGHLGHNSLISPDDIHPSYEGPCSSWTFLHVYPCPTESFSPLSQLIDTSKEPVCPRVELILKIIIILLIIFLGFIKSKPC